MTGIPGTVVVLSSTEYRGHQLYDQRLARALVEHARVLYVDPPRSVVGRRGASQLADDGVQVVAVHTMPFGRRRLLAPMTAVFRALTTRRALRGAPRPHAFIVTAAHPLTVRLLGKGLKSYLLKDDYAAGASLIGVPRAVVERRRRVLLGLVDRVAVVSPALAESAAGMGATGEVSVIPPGCLLSEDQSALPPIVGRRPRAVFIGMLSDRIDFDVLDAVVAAGVDIVAVGRQQGTFSDHSRLARLSASGALHSTGQLSAEEVLEQVRSCDFALLPYTDSEFNRASFPLKLLEYLAAGKPVMASPLPAVRWLKAPHVHEVASADHVAAALPAVLAAAGDPHTREVCRAFAARHTWADRARRHIALVTEA